MTEALKSVNVTVLDQDSPFQALTAGEGAASRLKQVEDTVSLTAAGLVVGSTYRMCRVPANAKIKKVEVWSDAALDTNAASTLAFDFSLAFSDAPRDGTPVDYQGLAPASTLDGTLVADTDATRNKVFGSVAQGNNTAIPVTDITLNGLAALSKVFLDLVAAPLSKFFGLVNGQGYDIKFPGYMDVVAYVNTAAATAAAGNLNMRVTYAAD